MTMEKTVNNVSDNIKKGPNWYYMIIFIKCQITKSKTSLRMAVSILQTDLWTMNVCHSWWQHH